MCGPGSLGPDDPGCFYRKTSFGYAPPSGDPVHSNFLFLLEALGPEEVEAGRNAVGPTGKTFNKLLRGNTPLLRSEQCVANTVCCRPVLWEPCAKCNGSKLGEKVLDPSLTDLPDYMRDSDTWGLPCKSCGGEGQVPARLPYNNDHVTVAPTPGQVRECAARYTDALIQNFQGKVIMALGKTALEYMVRRKLSIGTHRGTIFEPGLLKKCGVCDGTRQVSGKARKCAECAGRGNLRDCREHVRARKLCPQCDKRPCAYCQGTGQVAGSLRACKECEGGGLVPDDPENPFICDRLKPGQLLFATFHPAYLGPDKNPTQWPVVARDFSRLAHLGDELVLVAGTRYDEYPPLGFDRESALLAADTLSVDLETPGKLEPTEGDIVCIGATNESGYGCAFAPRDPRIPRILSVPQIVGQNFVLFDRWWLHHHNHPIPDTTKIWDTRFAGKLLNPDTPNDLVFLAGEFATPPVRGYWKTRENYRDRKEYVCCLDVDATLRVKNGQYEALRSSGQLNIMENYIIPLSSVVFKMRAGGMRIDRERMSDACRALESELSDTRGLLPEWGGTHTENQAALVQRQLYDIFKLPSQRNRKTGRPTGNADALEELVGRLETGHRSVNHLSDDRVEEALDFIHRIQYLRGLSKLASSFLRYRLSPQDYIHPALNPCGAGTFRFTCQDPNAQQVPDCTCGLKDKACKAQCEYAKADKPCKGACPTCRGARFIFIPDHPDWELMSVDVKQAEICGFLWKAEEWGVLDKVLRGGLDAHWAIASRILGRDPTKAERADYKNTTFAMLFGEQDRTTAFRLHKPLEEIQAARAFYFKMLPGVPEFRKSVIQEVRNRGYVESPAGIRRYIYLERETGRAANQACNHPIQNIPPMVIGEAMIRLDRELPAPARMLMQVHDELLLTYPKAMRKLVYDCVYANLRKPVSWLPAAPLGMAGGLVFNLDFAVGPNWGAMEELK